MPWLARDAAHALLALFALRGGGRCAAHAQTLRVVSGGVPGAASTDP